MMEGKVNAILKPFLPLSLIAPDGTEFPVEVMVDTAFSGEVSLPLETIKQMGLKYEYDDVYVVGSNEEHSFSFYKGAQAYWHEKDVEVLVMEAEGDAVIGMELLKGSSVFVEAKPNGKVRIKELPPPRTRKR